MPVIEGGVLNQLFRPVQSQPEPNLCLVLLKRLGDLRRLCAPLGSQRKFPASAVLLRDLELQPSLVCQRFDNRIDGLLGDANRWQMSFWSTVPSASTIERITSNS